ncbi:MAG: cyclase family protein [Betaproteobacteria bacterium]|nr:cyclase family protein [Betaproteobacteria bacterium]
MTTPSTQRKPMKLKNSLQLMIGAMCASVAMTTSLVRADDALVPALKAAKVIELNFIWDARSPLLSFNPPFAASLTNTHKQTKGWIPELSFAADMMFFSGQHGAPTLDALGHIGHNGKLFGGLDAEQSEMPSGLTALGVEAYPKEKFVNRAVLLDVARFKNVEALAPGEEITGADLEATAKAQKVDVRAGDSVLIRTGYGKFFGDKAKYMGLRPGPGESGAKWLAEKKIFLAGADQLTFEVYPEKGTIFPAHRILIADSGIYIVENMNLEELSAALAARKDYAFSLVLNPLRLRGMTGSPLNAFAILP